MSNPKIYKSESFIIYDYGKHNSFEIDSKIHKIPSIFHSFFRKRCINIIKFIGNNNKIVIDKRNHFNNCTWLLGGDNNFLSIEYSPYPICVNINCDWLTNNKKISIGKDFSSGYSEIIMNEDDASLEIGDDVMISFGVLLELSDGHAILDANTRKIINRYSFNIIENHVWIGRNSVILKNCFIPEGCVVAHSSVVTKKFNEKCSIIGGTPAKIVKQNILWRRENASLMSR